MRDKELVNALVKLKVHDAKIGPLLNKSSSVKKHELSLRTSPNFMLNPDSALSVRDASKL